MNLTLMIAPKRPESMFQAFDAILLVLDHHGKILDYKTGNGAGLQPVSAFPMESPARFQDFVPVDVARKYENAIRELHNGNRFVSFDYILRSLTGESWYESCLIPFTDGQNIMFMWNVTANGKQPVASISFSQDMTLQNWLKVLRFRDQETEDHAYRVTEMTLRLAERVGVADSELIHIRRGAMLHDIGKIAIPDRILFKPAPLTESEWDIMRHHPIIATEILGSNPYLAPALAIPRSHHEKWDGSGYPDGLAGENIPISARIFAFADVYDALTSDRPYRKAWRRVDALDYILKQSGRHFDPSIAPVFIDMI